MWINKCCTRLGISNQNKKNQKVPETKLVQHAVMKTVIVLGAGVGGLSAAHALSRKGFRVIVVERHNVIGGLARSGYSSEGYPTEYCWRIYGPNYVNLRRIMQEIPLIRSNNNNNNRNQTVHDNLVNIKDHIVSSSQGNFILNNNLSSIGNMWNTFTNVPRSDLWKFFRAYINGITAGDQVTKKYLTAVTWKDYVGPLQSKYFEKLAIYSVAPFLGEDLRKVSAAAIIESLEGLSVANQHNLSVMNGPTNDQWFDHWYAYLTQDCGVDIRVNTLVTRVNVFNDDNTIDSVLVQDLHSNEQTIITADYFVCALSVESAAVLFANEIPTLSTLARLGRQSMVGVQLYLDSKFTFQHRQYKKDCPNGAIYLPESPWQLVIELQGYIWNYTDSFHRIKDIWSVGLDDPVTPGNLIKKPFPQCTREEIRIEVWHQIVTSRNLQSILISDDGKLLHQVNVIGFHLWDTYKYENGQMQTYEPKFSDNIHTYQFAPDTHTHIDNLFFATAYTKGKTFVYNMEKACTNGLLAANAILENEEIEPVEIFIKSRELPSLDWIRTLDDTITDLFHNTFD